MTLVIYVQNRKDKETCILDIIFFSAPLYLLFIFHPFNDDIKTSIFHLLAKNIYNINIYVLLRHNNYLGKIN